MPRSARDLCTPGCYIRLTREISHSWENMIVAEDFVLYGGVTYRPWRWHHVASKPGDPVTCDVVISQKKRIFGYVAVKTSDLAWPYLRWIWRAYKRREQAICRWKCRWVVSFRFVWSGGDLWNDFTTLNRLKSSYSVELDSEKVICREFAESDCGFTLLPLSFALNDQRRCIHFMVTWFLRQNSNVVPFGHRV